MILSAITCCRVASQSGQLSPYSASLMLAAAFGSFPLLSHPYSTPVSSAGFGSRKEKKISSQHREFVCRCRRAVFAGSPLQAAPCPLVQPPLLLCSSPPLCLSRQSAGCCRRTQSRHMTSIIHLYHACFVWSYVNNFKALGFQGATTAG